jgi:ClpP class serine protease
MDQSEAYIILPSLRRPTWSRCCFCHWFFVSFIIFYVHDTIFNHESHRKALTSNATQRFSYWKLVCTSMQSTMFVGVVAASDDDVPYIQSSLSADELDTSTTINSSSYITDPFNDDSPALLTTDSVSSSTRLANETHATALLSESSESATIKTEEEDEEEEATSAFEVDASVAAITSDDDTVDKMTPFGSEKATHSDFLVDLAFTSAVEVNPDYIGPSSSAKQRKSRKRKKTILAQRETQNETTLDSETLWMNHQQQGNASSIDGNTTDIHLQRRSVKDIINRSLRRSCHVPFQLVHEKRAEITVILAFIAYRKEIARFLWRKFSVPIKINPTTGEVLQRGIKIYPTAILKLFLFLEVMRRFRQLSVSQKNNSTIPETPPLEEKDDGTNLEATRYRRLLLPLLFLFGSGPLSPYMILSRVLGLMSMYQFHGGSHAYLPPVEQHYTFETWNNRYTIDGFALEKAVLLGAKGITSTNMINQLFGATSTISSSNTSLLYIVPRMTQSTPPTPVLSTVIVLDWTKLDASVSGLDQLRDEITFLVRHFQNLPKSDISIKKNSTDVMLVAGDGTEPIALSQANTLIPPTSIEIVVLLESSGGNAADYALAAEQIMRLRRLHQLDPSASPDRCTSPPITVTICVDKVAASGGYMIACTSSPGRLFATKFAVLGSIGVVGQSVNVQRALEGYGIRSMVFRGGKAKAPVGLLGEITNEGLRHVQRTVDTVHRAFQRHVVECRPILEKNIALLASGDVWLGYDAIDMGLIDHIISSDEYLSHRMTHGALVLKLIKRKHRGLFSRASRVPLGTNLSWQSMSEKSTFWSSVVPLSLQQMMSTFLNQFQSRVESWIQSPLSSTVRTNDILLHDTVLDGMAFQAVSKIAV